MAAPARVAVDVQALQPGSGADPATADRIRAWVAALERAGHLAAVLATPDRPPPALDEALAVHLVWDTRTEARRLCRTEPRLVRHVPAPYLDTEAAAPAGRVVSAHWAEAGVPRLVSASAPPSAADPGRVAARAEWMAGADGWVALDRESSAAEEWDSVVGTVTSRLDEDPGKGGTGSAGPPPRLALFGPYPPAGGGIGVYNARFAAAATASGLAVDGVVAGAPCWQEQDFDLVAAASFGVDVPPASYDAVVYTLGNSDGHLATIEAALRHPGWLWLHEARLPAVATAALDACPDDEYERRLGALLRRAYPGRAPAAAGRDHLALARSGIGLVAPLAERAAGIFVNSEAARRAVLLDLPPLAWAPPVVVLPPACPPVRAHRRTFEEGDALAVAFGVVSMSKRPDLLVDAAAAAGVRLAFVGPCPPLLAQVIGERAGRRGVAGRVSVEGAVSDDEWWRWMARADVAVQLRDSYGGEMSAAVLDALAAGLPVLTNLASAGDYPAGTVERFEGGEVDELAGRLASLMADPERRAARSAAGTEFAAANQMVDLVAKVVAAAVG